MPLSEPQRQVITSDKRFRVLLSGRRFGKTFVALNELAKFGRFPNKKIFYIYLHIYISIYLSIYLSRCVNTGWKGGNILHL